MAIVSATTLTPTTPPARSQAGEDRQSDRPDHAPNESAGRNYDECDNHVNGGWDCWPRPPVHAERNLQVPVFAVAEVLAIYFLASKAQKA